MNKLKLAACGVDCNECGTYNKEHDIKVAESMVEWYREKGWIKKMKVLKQCKKIRRFVKAVGGRKAKTT